MGRNAEKKLYHAHLLKVEVFAYLESQHSKAWLYIQVRTSRYLTNVAVYDYAH